MRGELLIFRGKSTICSNKRLPPPGSPLAGGDFFFNTSARLRYMCVAEETWTALSVIPPGICTPLDRASADDAFN